MISILVGESVQSCIPANAEPPSAFCRAELVGRCAAGRAPTNSQLRDTYHLCFPVANAHRLSDGSRTSFFRKGQIRTISERHTRTRTALATTTRMFGAVGAWGRGARMPIPQGRRAPSAEHVSADDVCDVLTRKDERPTLATRVHTSHLGRSSHRVHGTCGAAS